MKKQAVEQLRIEADEWLNPKGFYVSISTGDGTWLVYTPHSADNINIKVTITCWLDERLEKKCKVGNCCDFMFTFRLETGDLSFKHSNIDKMIRKARIYGDLCKNHDDELRD